MTGKDLFEGLSHIDERYIEEAETAKSISFPWLKVGAVAACFCLLLCAFFYGNHAQSETLPDVENLLQIPPAASIPPSETPTESISVPNQGPVSEVPSVILRVEQMTDEGFVGIVAELVDTDVFDLGMELNVVLPQHTNQNIIAEADSEFKSQAVDYKGVCVLVRFISYDRDTNTIVAEFVQEKG